MSTHATSRPTCLISFDVEEAFQIEAAYGVIDPSTWDACEGRLELAMDWIFETLNHHEVKATFFTLGWIARKYPTVIKRMVEEGHELACHGDMHQRLMRLNPEALKTDLSNARKSLEDIGGVAVKGYRAPTWSLTRETHWALEVLLESGFEYDSSIQPVKHPQYGVSDAPTTPYLLTAGAQRDTPSLIEIPPLTRPWMGGRMAVAGGGYFRLYPLGMMLGGVKKMNQAEQPSMLYFHPWEFDPDQTRMALPTLQKFRTYVGIKSSRGKFERLLSKVKGVSVHDWLLDQKDPSSWSRWTLSP